MAMFTLMAATMALRPPLPVIAVVMVLEGFAGMLWNIAQVSYRQRHIPASLLGRVNSAFRFIGTGPAGLGAFAFGSLVAWGESGAQSEVVLDDAVTLPYIVAACLGAVLTAYASRYLRMG
jgi:hypothetical protein